MQLSINSVVCDEWMSAIDKGNLVGAIAIGLSKAFDSLPHGLLIAKLTA